MAAAARRMLVMFTKPGCTLCDEAKEVIFEVGKKVLVGETHFVC